MPPNFYYNMEDYCIQRAAEHASWSWSSVRPNPVCGFSTGSAMNLTMTIAVYASICKQLGLPLRCGLLQPCSNLLQQILYGHGLTASFVLLRCC